VLSLILKRAVISAGFAISVGIPEIVPAEESILNPGTISLTEDVITS
jgi:hypothetical protein